MSEVEEEDAGSIPSRTMCFLGWFWVLVCPFVSQVWDLLFRGRCASPPCSMRWTCDWPRTVLLFISNAAMSISRDIVKGAQVYVCVCVCMLLIRMCMVTFIVCSCM